MDTRKECKIPEYGNLAKLKDFKVVVGMKQLRKALERGTAKWVFLAENADPAITIPLSDACDAKAVPLTWIGSMQQLGLACGIEVGAAAAAVID